MKRKTIATSIAVAAVLAVTPTALSACSGDHYGKISFDAQDTSYAVTSQGGSAVAYGNYLYFINGTRGYDDSNGSANVWNDVVKGALYRAEFNGEKYTDAQSLVRFRTAPDSNGLEFKYTAGEDYYGEPINIVDVTKIAPKTVGTASYERGGIFIYDNYVYFASPNNLKSSTGTVQTTRTDFFMMPLSGGEPSKLYTTGEGVDTSASEYAFYKYGGAVYLVVREDTDIVSVRINTRKAKADDPVRFEVNATSVYFPVRDTYYEGISNNTVEDFIYYVRERTDDDVQRTGTVIEAMRPDGAETFVVSMANKTETIEGVRDGMFFYRTTNTVGDTVMAYTNLHDQLMLYSTDYAAEQEALPAGSKTTHISGQFSKTVSSDITSTYVFRPDILSNEVYMIGVTDSEIELYEKNGTMRVLCNSTGTPKFIQNNYLYFAGSDSDYYRVPLYKNMDNYGEAKQLATGTTSAGISCDYAAGYFTYFAQVDEWADAYAFFYKVDGAEGMEPQFVGLRTSADIPTEEQINGETTDDDTDDA
ncbi:MAG: hypothetical protein NC184_05965 [Roseburia sp.]|nr:hypothetical protein [Roseburia sp.]